MEDQPALLQHAQDVLKSMLLKAVESHPQFQSEFPRRFCLLYDLLGIETDDESVEGPEWILELLADDCEVQVWFTEGVEEMKVVLSQ